MTLESCTGDKTSCVPADFAPCATTQVVRLFNRFCLTTAQRVDRRDRLDHLSGIHNGAGVIWEIDIEGGMHFHA